MRRPRGRLEGWLGGKQSRSDAFRARRDSAHNPGSVAGGIASGAMSPATNTGSPQRFGTALRLPPLSHLSEVSRWSPTRTPGPTSAFVGWW